MPTRRCRHRSSLRRPAPPPRPPPADRPRSATSRQLDVAGRSSDGDQITECRQLRRPDPRYRGEIVDGQEATVVIPPGDDGGGGCRPDAGERLELFTGGGVEVDRADRVGRAADVSSPADRAATTSGPSTSSSIAGTRTWLPSATGAAKFSRSGSAPPVKPPAAATASTMRLPGASSTRPGRLTSPITWTIRSAGTAVGCSDGVVAADGVGGDRGIIAAAIGVGAGQR